MKDYIDTKKAYDLCAHVAMLSKDENYTHIALPRAIRDCTEYTAQELDTERYSAALKAALHASMPTVPDKAQFMRPVIRQTLSDEEVEARANELVAFAVDYTEKESLDVKLEAVRLRFESFKEDHADQLAILRPLIEIGVLRALRSTSRPPRMSMGMMAGGCSPSAVDYFDLLADASSVEELATLEEQKIYSVACHEWKPSKIDDDTLNFLARSLECYQVDCELRNKERAERERIENAQKALAEGRAAIEAELKLIVG